MHITVSQAVRNLGHRLIGLGQGCGGMFHFTAKNVLLQRNAGHVSEESCQILFIVPEIRSNLVYGKRFIDMPVNVIDDIFEDLLSGIHTAVIPIECTLDGCFAQNGSTQ